MNFRMNSISIGIPSSHKKNILKNERLHCIPYDYTEEIKDGKCFVPSHLYLKSKGKILYRTGIPFIDALYNTFSISFC